MRNSTAATSQAGRGASLLSESWIIVRRTSQVVVDEIKVSLAVISFLPARRKGSSPVLRKNATRIFKCRTAGVVVHKVWLARRFVNANFPARRESTKRV